MARLSRTSVEAFGCRFWSEFREVLILINVGLGPRSKYFAPSKIATTFPLTMDAFLPRPELNLLELGCLTHLDAIQAELKLHKHAADLAWEAKCGGGEVPPRL